VFSMKNLAALVVLGHGLGFILWFLASWFPRIPIRGNDRHWIFSDTQTMSGTFGRACGLLSLALIPAFLVLAWGIFTEDPSWKWGAVLAVVSMVVIVPWWKGAGHSSAIGATLVNVLLVWAAFSSDFAADFVPKG